ncbi:MAG: hypothetical protein IJG68_03190 [Bacilli bacterium]|nr:hypothetical protein [Bacilli bacterium]
MYFLIGVIILIVFCLTFYFYIRIRIRRTLDSFGFQGMNIKEIIEEARLEDQEVPKSLSSMDRIYLEQIRKDFPKLNINELKRESEKVLLDCIHGVEKNDTSRLNGKIKSFVKSMIHDNEGKNVTYDDVKIHNTVVADYKNEKGIATIHFATSYQYYLNTNGHSVKTQDRCRTEFICVYDIQKVEIEKKSLSIHCPNCGSPIRNFSHENCEYCGSSLIENMKKVFVCNDIVRY